MSDSKQQPSRAVESSSSEERTNRSEYVERSDVGVSLTVKLKQESMLQTINDLGATPEKSSRDYLPSLDDWAWPHFTRGLFDGDGHARNNPNLSLVIVQNRDRLKRLQQHTPVEGTIHEGNETHRIGWWGDDFEQMVLWMYPEGYDTEPALDRKREPLLDWV
jgi:hypothetical protein